MANHLAAVVRFFCPMTENNALHAMNSIGQGKKHR